MLMGRRSAARLRSIVKLPSGVVGCSRLMEAAEAATLTRLRSLMREVIEPVTADHRGRIFKTTGDGALVDFASAIDAVESAIVVQTRLPAREPSLAEQCSEPA